MFIFIVLWKEGFFYLEYGWCFENCWKDYMYFIIVFDVGGGDFVGGGWYWCNEYYVGVSDWADAGNWYLYGCRCVSKWCFVIVFDWSCIGLSGWWCVGNNIVIVNCFYFVVFFIWLGDWFFIVGVVVGVFLFDGYWDFIWLVICMKCGMIGFSRCFGMRVIFEIKMLVDWVGILFLGCI